MLESCKFYCPLRENPYPFEKTMFKRFFVVAMFGLIAPLAFAQEEAAQEAAAQAHETAADAQASHEGGDEHGAAAGGIYVVGKYFTSPGASYQHSGHTIKGETASGFGVDVGYTLGGPLAVEFAYSTGSGTVGEGQIAPISHLSASTTTEKVTATANYSSMALVGVYTLHLSESGGLIGKLGLISETEDLGELADAASSSGVVYAIGYEHKLFGHNEVVVEYEDTNIEGPRAYTLFLGWKHGF